MADSPVESLRERHERLEATSAELLDATATVAAHVEVAGEVDSESVARALEASAATWDELGDFLEEAAEVDRGVEEGEIEESVWSETVHQLEPPPGPRGGDTSGREFDDVSPLRRLSAPYGVLLELEKDLRAEEMKRPFRLRKLKELWGDFERIGGDRPNEGLGSRLERFAEFAGSALDRGDPPWSQSDREAVAELSEFARGVLDWSERECRRREREAWLERVDRWLEAAEDEQASAARMTEIPRRLLVDLPATVTEAIADRLERLAALEEIPAELRRRAEEARED